MDAGGYLVHWLAALPDRSTLAPRLYGAHEGLPGGAMRTGQACLVGDIATHADAVAVSDTGHGIPAADLPHVFDKFYRVKGRATANTPGTGLGLAIVKSIVDLDRGRVRVEGAGSTFFVDLPLGDR